MNLLNLIRGFYLVRGESELDYRNNNPSTDLEGVRRRFRSNKDEERNVDRKLEALNEQFG